MSFINHNTKSLLGLSVAGSDDTSCYSEDSQPRICFDEYCTFPMGDMCKACKLDREFRKKRVSRGDRVQLTKVGVEETNVQRNITSYSGQEFVGGADDREAIEDKKREERELLASGTGEEFEGKNDCRSDGTEIPNHLVEDDRPDFSGFISAFFTSEWTTRRNPSSISKEKFPSTARASILLPDFDRDTHLESRLSNIFNESLDRQVEDVRLESWLSDIFDRTLDGQMEDTIFSGGAEDDPLPVRCPLCGNPVGDPRDQHLIKCQFAHDEQERMEASLWKYGNGN